MVSEQKSCEIIVGVIKQVKRKSQRAGYSNVPMEQFLIMIRSRE